MITPLRLLAGVGLATSVGVAFLAWCAVVIGARADERAARARYADALFDVERALFRAEHGD